MGYGVGFGVQVGDALDVGEVDLSAIHSLDDEALVRVRVRVLGY